MARIPALFLLRPEFLPYDSIEIIHMPDPARAELEAWDAFRTEQLEPAAEPLEAVDELEGSRCTVRCGYCGRCS